MASMEWSPGGCCCVASGPWDWYADFHETAGGSLDEVPSTPGTPFFARVPSIYDNDGTGTFLSADCSYDANDPAYEWSIEMLSTTDGGEGANWLEKRIVSTITPSGVSSSERAYAYIFQGSNFAMVQLDAVAKTVDWIVTDANWGSDPAMGGISITHFSGAATIGDWDDSFIPNLPDGGQCANSAGLFSWVFDDTMGSGTNLTAIAFQSWTIGIAGGKTFVDSNFYVDWLIAHSGDDSYFPWYSYDFQNEQEMFVAGDPGHVISDNPFPIAQASQANIAVGIYHPHMLDFTTTVPPYDFDATVEVHIGPVILDPDGIPYVSGSVLWSKTKSYKDGQTGIAIETRIDLFDASAATTVAVMTYRFKSGWEAGTLADYSTNDKIEVRTVLVGVGSYSDDVLVHRWKGININSVTDDNDMSGYSDGGQGDMSDFYPRWLAVRALHTGGAMALQRVPFNQGEQDDDWGTLNSSFGTMGQMKLCHAGSGGAWDVTSRHTQASQATGTITMTTTGSPTTFILTAAGGGDGDREDWGNGAISIVLVQGTERDCVYDQSSHTLTVTLDIAGGDNTIGDVMDTIGRNSTTPGGGDFYASSAANESLVIDSGDTGSGTLSGAVNGVTPTSYVLEDSSDTYIYVSGFPYRLPDYPRFIRTSWAVSHDGTVWNPLGTGLRVGRLTPDPTFMMPKSGYSCIKNSELVTLAPAKEEI